MAKPKENDNKGFSMQRIRRVVVYLQDIWVFFGGFGGVGMGIVYIIDIVRRGHSKPSNNNFKSNRSALKLHGIEIKYNTLYGIHYIKRQNIEPTCYFLSTKLSPSRSISAISYLNKLFGCIFMYVICELWSFFVFLYFSCDCEICLQSVFMSIVFLC